MTHLLLAAALSATSLGTTLDTTIAVRPGSRLELENFNGAVHVTAWSRPAVRIQAAHGRHTSVGIERAAEVLSISSEGRMGPPGEVEYSITMPATMALKVSGVDTDIDVDGVEARIEAETVQGEVLVRGGRDHITASSVQGKVQVQGARAELELSSVNESVVISDVVGRISAETVNGEVSLENVRSGELDVSTVNGDVRFEGALADDGQYHFSTHNGTVRVCIPEGSNVSVSASTVNGEFHTDFPVAVHSSAGRKHLEFTLGSGRAELELESFQGSVELCRQGATPRSPTPKSAPNPRPHPKSGDSNEEE